MPVAPAHESSGNIDAEFHSETAAPGAVDRYLGILVV